MCVPGAFSQVVHIQWVSLGTDEDVDRIGWGCLSMPSYYPERTLELMGNLN